MSAIKIVEVIDTLEAFEIRPLSEWIDYVERHIFRLNVTMMHRQSSLRDLNKLLFTKQQSEALNKFLTLPFIEQRAVIAVAKVLCKTRRQTPESI